MMPTEGYEAKHGVFEGPAETVEFDYAVYALGAGLPDPVNVWKPPFGAETPEDQTLGAGTKRSGVRFMERKAETLKQAQRILIVGGGALGIRTFTSTAKL
jgi:NADH dehydrogenase FAD-containing subunit